MGRVAVIDLGTNSTRLIVADVGDERVDEIHFETTITRLGEGVDRRRRLLPLPIPRVRNCLSGYRRTLEALGALLTLRGVTLGRALPEQTLVADVGGGSTELVVGGPGGLRFHESLDIGSGRLTERFLPSDPPTGEELDRCAA